MILSLLGLAMQRPDLIDLRLEASPLPKVIERLKEATGRKLEFSGDLKDEVLLIAVRKVDPDELLARVAIATSARWESTSAGGLRLSRSKAQEELQRSDWVDRRHEHLKAITKEFRANALPKDEAMSVEQADLLLHRMANSPIKPPFTDFAQFKLMRSLHEQLPIGRLFARLMNCVDLRKAAEKPASQKVVFSTRPTQAQQPFTSRVQPALDLLQVEQTALVQAVSKLSASPIMGSEAGGADESFFSTPMRDKVADVRLTVLERGLEWRAELFSANGERLSAFSVSLTPSRNVAAEIDPSMLPFSSKRVELSKKCVAFNATLRGEGIERDPWHPAGGDLLRNLLAPESADPLSYSATETILQVADVAQANFVGSIPDAFIYGSTIIGNAAVALKLTLKDGWLNARPSEYGDRLARVPRKPLGEFAREVARTSATSLKAQNIAASLGIRSSIDPKMRILTAYERGLGAPQSAVSSPIALEIYRGLSRGRREVLDYGDSVRFGDLPLATRRRVHELLLTSPEENLTEAPPTKPTWRTEATQVWVKAIPDDALISATIAKTARFLDQDSVPRCNFGVNELASSLARLAKGAEPLLPYKIDHKLLTGENVRLQFVVSYDGLTLRTAIECTEVPEGTKAKVYGDLPAELRKVVEEMKERYLAAGG